MRFQRTAVAWILCSLVVVGLVGSAFAGDPLARERSMMKAVCKQVSSELQSKYYDPNMNGLDWKALTAQTQEKIEGAKSLGEMMTAVHILVHRLSDSHTAFIPPGRNVSYKFGYGAKPFGDEIRVFSMKKNGAAEKAGLQIGDRILAINKHAPTRGNYDDMMFFFKVVLNLPVLNLTVQRGDNPPMEIRVEGTKKVESIHKEQTVWDSIYDLIREFDKELSWHSRSFKDGIGYAQIRYFKFEGSGFMSGVVDQSAPKKAIILDFRSNGGGEENALKEFAGMFEDSEQTLATTIGRKKTESMIVKPRRPHYTQPLIILVDSDTGSAAEMFARHMQLRKRALIIGDHTAGAVTRAEMFYEELGTDAVVPYGVYIGTSKVVMSDGNALEKVGVTPDVSCVPTGKDLATQNDPCLLLAIQTARKAAGLAEDAELKQVSTVWEME